MKKVFVFIIALSLGLFFSCSKEDANVTKENKATFKATTEAATKTALEEDGSVYKVVWQSGDEIVVIDGNSYIGVYSTTSTTSHAEFKYESGSEAKDPDYMAMYPVAFFNSGYPAIPATQNYVEGNISGSPMYAESSTENLAFKNICGIIRLNISTTMSGKKVRKIILGADQGMSGTVVNAATLVADGYVAAVSGTEGIVLDCGENGVAISSTAKPFHIAVPQNSYTSLSITVITTDGEYQVRTAKKNIAVTRSSITDITLAFSNMAAVGGLVNHWPFTGNAKDVVGGIDATVTGATLTTDRFGNADRAYLFENGNQMAIGDAGNFGTSSFTANLWINSTQNRSSGANMIRTDGGTGGAGWFVRFVNFGRIEIWTSGIGYTSPDTYNDGNWHMVTFVRDAENSEGKLYVDGVYIGGFTGLANVSNLYQTHYLGSYGGGEFYVGKMDDVRLYDKALTEAEISALYTTPSTIIINLPESNDAVTIPAGTDAKLIGSNSNRNVTVEGGGSAIYLDNATMRKLNINGDATIDLTGTNTINDPDYQNPIDIKEGSTATFRGDGTFNLNAYYTTGAIVCENNNANIVIEGGTLNLVSGAGAIHAISAGGLTISGGTVSTSGDIYAEKDVAISGGVVNAIGSAQGIYVKGGDLLITGGTVTAEQTAGLSWGSGPDALVAGIVVNSKDGAGVEGGNLTISGGTVNAIGHIGPGIGSVWTRSGWSPASWTKSIVISGGTVTASTEASDFGAIHYSGFGNATRCDVITITEGITSLKLIQGATAAKMFCSGDVSATFTVDGKNMSEYFTDPSSADWTFDHLQRTVSTTVNENDTWTFTKK